MQIRTFRTVIANNMNMRRYFWVLGFFCTIGVCVFARPQQVIAQNVMFRVEYENGSEKELSADARSAVQRALTHWTGKAPANNTFTVLAAHPLTQGALLSVTPLSRKTDAKYLPPVLLEQRFTVLAVKTPSGWQAAIEWEPEAATLLAFIPETELSLDARHAIFVQRERIIEDTQPVIIPATIQPPSIPQPQVLSFNRSAAVNWAAANNRNDGQFYGSSQGRWCTTYIGNAWVAGGLSGASSSWIGNGQIVTWMLNHPNDWEFRDRGSLVEGDIILFSSNPDALNNWSYLFPNGASLWDHSAFVNAVGRLSAWNAEYWDKPQNWYDNYGLPYNKGVHILDAPTPTPGTEIIVPENDTAHTERTGNLAYFYPPPAGSNTRNGAYFTYGNSGGPDNTIKYKPTLPQDGCYRVWYFVAWIQTGSDDSGNVPVEINHRNGNTVVRVNVNQININLGQSNPNRWVDVGAYQFSSNAGAVGQYVKVRDDTGESVSLLRIVPFDDIKWVFDASCTTPTPTVTNTPIPPTATPTSTPIPPRPDTIGVYKAGVWYLRSANSTGNADIITYFGGDPSDLPVAGDWNGDGVDSIGVYRGSTGVYYLSNSNTAPAAAYSLVFGNPGDTPFAGKWVAGATHDGVGVYRNTNGILYQKNDLATGYADYFAIFGNPGDKGFAGDWNADGRDSIGIYRSSSAMWYLTNNSLPSGITYGDVSYLWDIGTNLPVVGDWDANRTATGGAFNPAAGIFTLNNANAGAGTLTSFAFGPTGGIPIAGKWIAGLLSPNAISILGGANPPDYTGGGDGNGVD